MLSMSPCCVVLASSAVGHAPLSHLQQLEANSLLLAAISSFKGAACYPPANTETSEDGSSLFTPLVELSTSPLVEEGTVSDLVVYKDWVRFKLRAAAELASKSRVWRDSGVVEKLQRAIALVDSGHTNKGRELACEVLGFNQLQSLATSNLQLTCPPASSSGAFSGSTFDLTSGDSGVSQFKVPALPAKRSRQQLDQQQQQVNSSGRSQQEGKLGGSSTQQQAHRKHNAPKRRATPQLLPAAPVLLAAAAAPDSSTHGETCCDEGLLSSWCPISGKRQRLLAEESSAASHNSQPGITTGSSCSSDSSSSQFSAARATPSRVTSTDASTPTSLLETFSGSATAPPAVGSLDLKTAHGAGSSSRAASHAEAVEALKQLLHEDPSLSRPSSDVLLFNKAKQQPIHNWSGTIKHRLKGRVVDLCKLTLQVPEPFLEEFPAALYAAEVRHRKSVSLGRHVVCRATLGTLTERQLASLAAMARGQLVALCALQTAELHLVPYFDNKNLVRMVGFLKIKAE